METSISRAINRCFMRFNDRAERIDSKQIADTFVSVGPLLDVLESHNNQLVYGRRGTGKTHALRHFMGLKNASGDIGIYVDCQNIGSNQSIYEDRTLPITERATRLLIDVCSALHSELLDVFTDPPRGLDLASAAPLLDELVTAISEVRVIGSAEVQTTEQESLLAKDATNLGVTVSPKPTFEARLQSEHTNSLSMGTTLRRQGVESNWIDFKFLNQAIARLAACVRPRRIWILLDEWSTVPIDIQPYLADLIRRTLFTVPNISVKIAAIEHRSNFKHDKSEGGYVGFELGADISPAINLDDYLVFDNNEERAENFFRNLIHNHVAVISKEIGIDLKLNRIELINRAFTQTNVFVEFVKACEGVPRDAMHILANVAQRANEAAISMPTLRIAALTFFQTDKLSAIQANPENRKMLDWIRDEVIGKRRTRAFLLPVGTEDEIIGRLFDRRALHIVKRSMSSAHRPGERFVVYKLDYGCYADLVNTDKATTGLLVADEARVEVNFEVPEDDGRSYRRALLDLSKYYAQNPSS